MTATRFCRSMDETGPRVHTRAPHGTQASALDFEGEPKVARRRAPVPRVPSNPLWFDRNRFEKTLTPGWDRAAIGMDTGRGAMTMRAWIRLIDRVLRDGGKGSGTVTSWSGVRS